MYQNSINPVVATILWTRDDIKQVLEDLDIPVTEENVDAFLERGTMNQLQNRSTEHGWEVLHDLVKEVKQEGGFKTTPVDTESTPDYKETINRLMARWHDGLTPEEQNELAEAMAQLKDSDVWEVYWCGKDLAASSSIENGATIESVLQAARATVSIATGYCDPWDPDNDKMFAIKIR